MFGILIFFGAVLVVSSDTSTCDPATQYQDGDNCCQMCGPGTKMLSPPVCEDAQCEPCPENEYQDAYTRDDICQRQPYCDPNKYFEFTRNNNKTSRVKCRCKPGYHCNSKDCLLCMPHTKCEPGSGVVSRGTDKEDTQCQVCPPNTFSNDTSAVSECLKHTICGGNTETEGTNESDTVCAVSRVSPGVIAIIIVGIILAMVVLSGFLFWKHASGPTKGKVKKFFGLCGWTSVFVPMQKDNPRNVEAEEFINVTPEEPGRPEREFSALETGAVENEEVGQPGETEQGYWVAQEVGRGTIITHPESQMNSMVSYN
ncbi:tumor necrosis factor receptor superfamily member 5 isoform X2 [Hypomesus transpacificus]|uniref:tumor necrosis factor receptor superfamily member 5 isoform X2 n=1 Tax=Hypomesus transpacificus TaxID=137520 RepID=UPI001F080459|nr:tumor necrosis factor receptor superfamily member 5 isoform X2 [Hypomesus transpacificus]XP_046895465.1 tumor necrosis factor receptor superfamily member 5 isoform X2 [Hypomesus transpacificus]